MVEGTDRSDQIFYTTRTEECNGETTVIKTGDVLCLTQTVCSDSTPVGNTGCDGSATCDNAQAQFDSTFEEFDLTFGANSAMPDGFDLCVDGIVYTRQRECQSIFTCVSPAVEVIAPAAMTSTGPGTCTPDPTNLAADCWYIGDRACQCPDSFEMHDARGRNPRATPTYEQTVNGVAPPAAGDPNNAFLPIKYFGGANSESYTYTCSTCDPCDAAQLGVDGAENKYISRQCSHGRVNMDFCHGTHPKDLGTTPLPITAAMRAEHSIPSSITEVPTYPVTRLTVIAAHMGADPDIKAKVDMCIVTVGGTDEYIVEARQFINTAVDVPFPQPGQTWTAAQKLFSWEAWPAYNADTDTTRYSLYVPGSAVLYESSMNNDADPENSVSNAWYNTTTRTFLWRLLRMCLRPFPAWPHRHFARRSGALQLQCLWRIPTQL